MLTESVFARIVIALILFLHSSQGRYSVVGGA